MGHIESGPSVMHLKVTLSAARSVTAHSLAQRLIQEYLAALKHGGWLQELDLDGLSLPPREKQLDQHAR